MTERKSPAILNRGASLAALAAAAGIAAPAAAQEFSVFELYYELNASDGDVGLHGKLDGDTWRMAEIKGPGGTFRVMKALANDDSVDFGLNELFFESNEPPLEDRSFADLKALFPPGVYEASGKTPTGADLAAEKTLTAALPCPPRLFPPMSDEDDLKLRWRLADGVYDPDTGVCDRRAAITIKTIEIVVDLTDPETGAKRSFDVLLSPEVRRIEVPGEFFENSEGREAKAEILVIEESGNRTAAEMELDLSDFEARRRGARR